MKADRKYQNDLKRAFNTLDTSETFVNSTTEPKVEDAALNFEKKLSTENRIVLWRTLATASSLTCGVLLILLLQGRAANTTLAIPIDPLPKLVAVIPEVAASEPIARNITSLDTEIVKTRIHAIRLTKIRTSFKTSKNDALRVVPPLTPYRGPDR
jgi:hypothetical protein